MSFRHSVTQWIDQLQADDPQARGEAARQIWNQYGDALLRLAQRNVGPSIRRREDEHDVLQSVFKSFCIRQERGQFDLSDRNDLWTVLVTLTLRKVANTFARHARQRRDFRRDVEPDSDESDIAADIRVEQAPADVLTPEDAAMIGDEMRRWLEMLPEQLQQIAFWKLEGYTNEEISGSDKLDCATRTVERKLERIRQIWRRAEQSADSAG